MFDFSFLWFKTVAWKSLLINNIFFILIILQFPPYKVLHCGFPNDRNTMCGFYPIIIALPGIILFKCVDVHWQIEFSSLDYVAINGSYNTDPSICLNNLVMYTIFLKWYYCWSNIHSWRKWNSRVTKEAIRNKNCSK